MWVFFLGGGGGGGTMGVGTDLQYFDKLAKIRPWFVVGLPAIGG
jgi:hypothetical protein